MITLTEELKTKIDTYFENISVEELCRIAEKYGLEKEGNTFLSNQPFTTMPVSNYNDNDNSDFTPSNALTKAA